MKRGLLILLAMACGIGAARAETLTLQQGAGDLLGKLVPILSDADRSDPGGMTLAKAAEARIAAQTALRRKMLWERHLKACQAMNVRPLSQEQWDALWPRHTPLAGGALGERYEY